MSLKILSAATTGLLLLTGWAQSNTPSRPPEPPPVPALIPQYPTEDLYQQRKESVAAPPKKPVVTYRTVRMRVTACSPYDTRDLEYYAANGFKGRTSHAVAAYYGQLPLGTQLSIPGYCGGTWVPVDSPGGSVIRKSARRGIMHIDVKFPSTRQAILFGNRWLNVKIKE
jgi:3D (Asp-Asp-Asp) domain-containing protein